MRRLAAIPDFTSTGGDMPTTTDATILVAEEEETTRVFLQVIWGR